MQGKVIHNRYLLEELIATGGMGQVWRVNDLALNRDVAMKILKDEHVGDKQLLQRFEIEARNTAKLAHPNVAAVYDFGEVDGRAYLVMELVYSQPLSNLLKRGEPWPMEKLLPILSQTARALHAAHIAGLVHRDVKPGNILISNEGQVKITDFGISTAVNQVTMTATGMVMGTAQYLAPEQALGKPATAASDIYALGIIAYEGLVGKRPFTGSSPVDIAISHVKKQVPEMPETIPSEMRELIMQMLAKDPQARPASAAQVASRFDTILGHTPSGGIPKITAFLEQDPAAEVMPTTPTDGVPQPARVKRSTVFENRQPGMSPVLAHRYLVPPPGMQKVDPQRPWRTLSTAAIEQRELDRAAGKTVPEPPVGPGRRVNLKKPSREARGKAAAQRKIQRKESKTTSIVITIITILAVLAIAIVFRDTIAEVITASPSVSDHQSLAHQIIDVRKTSG